MRLTTKTTRRPTAAEMVPSARRLLAANVDRARDTLGQYASPMPKSIASGTPRIVGCIPFSACCSAF